MGTLVANGTTLYRRSSHLVRTPITLLLRPVEMAVYQVAGQYNSRNFPNAGFIAQDSIDNVTAVGYDMLQAYSNPRDSRQIWRQVNTDHLPETVWYQGAFATSAPNLASTYSSCEAYSQLCAYKFQTPDNLRSLRLANVTCRFINGGAVVCKQSAGNRSSENVLWKNWPNVISPTWYVHFAACTSLGTPYQIAQNPSQLVDIGTISNGEARGIRDLWGFTGMDRDGAIPILSTLRTETMLLDATLGNYLAANINNGVWIVPMFYPDIQSPTEYRPNFISTLNGFWACASLWNITLEAAFE